MLPHQFFRLLADETRIRCLLIIAKEGSLCVAELVAALGMSQPKISRHLALLRSNGIVLDSRKGQWVFYQLEQELPGWMKKQIEGLQFSQCLAKQYQEDAERLIQYRKQTNCC